MYSKTPKNKYRNTIKGLRKNQSFKETYGSTKRSAKYKFSTNYYELLNEHDLPETEVSETSECVEATNSSGILDCLPEEIINNILEYLPKNTRIAILKNKYNKKTLQNKLNKMPDTYVFLSKLHKCASIAKEVVEYALQNKDILQTLPTRAIKYFKQETEHDKYKKYYKESFTKLILVALKYYTKIYKMKPVEIIPDKNLYYEYNGSFIMVRYNYSRAMEWNKKANEKLIWEKKTIEEMMFRLYAHITSF